MKIKNTVLGGTGLLLVLIICMGTMPLKKKLRGKLLQDHALFDAAKGKTCRLDSGTGTAMYLSYVHDNPQFKSKSPNTVHLMVHWKTAPQANQKYQLPHPDISVCYWEKGDLLMFHTFSAEGLIEFGKIQEDKFAEGTLDLKLVRPHHNFSNSDYHYVGGNFRLEVSPVDK